MTDLIIGAVVAILGFVGAFFLGNRRGRKEAQHDQAERQAKADAKATNRAKEAQDEVDRMSDDAVADRLRERADK